nr:histidine kinase [uncultured Flavobacterium sp.]
MIFRKLTILILLLVSCCRFLYGQVPNAKDKTYISIEVAFAPVSQLNETFKGDTVDVQISNGFFKVRPTTFFNESSTELYSQMHLKESGAGDIEKIVLKKDGTGLYILPNQEVRVDILQKKTDKLIKRHIIRRPILIPEITFYHQKGNIPIPFKNSSSEHHDELSISPGDQLRIHLSEREDYFKGLETEITLRNLTTKKMLFETGKKDLTGLKLEANTEYELRYNYVFQKESVRTIYIHVKPHWYQSGVMYIFLLFLIVGIGFWMIAKFFRKKLRRSEKEQQKLEAAAIKLQTLLNPHFTFNALSSIQGLMNTDRVEKANHYLEEFSLLLRKTLAKNKDVFNDLDQELEMMRMYISLEALRFNFSWKIEVSSEIDPSEVEIPTMLLQPIIENAIRHGLSGLGEKGQILVVCKQEKDNLIIMVKDNGTWKDKSHSSGYGLSLTTERINTINKIKKDQNIILEFNRHSGTEVIFTFHNWLK